MQKKTSLLPFKRIGNGKVSIPSHPFMISVCTSLDEYEGKDSTPTFDGELNLLRTAILYADQVTLCSVQGYLANERNTLHTCTDANKILDILIAQRKGYLNNTIFADENIHEMKAQLENYLEAKRTLENIRSRGSKSDLRYAEKQVLDQTRKVLKEYIAALPSNDYERRFINSGLRKAIDSGLVVVDNLIATDFYETMAQGGQALSKAAGVGYCARLMEVVASGTNYPLFDSGVNALIGSLSQPAGFTTEAAVTISGGTSKNAKHCALAANVLERLPNFEKASFDELLDIRETLRKPLKSFRSGMMTFSESIKHEPWKEGFEAEANDHFMKTIDPAVEHLDTLIRQDTYLKELLNFTDQPAKIATALVAGIATASSFAHVIPATMQSGLAVGATTLGVTALMALQKWKERVESRVDNQLYYFVKAGHRLGNI